MGEERRPRASFINGSEDTRPDAIIGRIEELQGITVALLDQARVAIDAGAREQGQLRAIADCLTDELQAYQVFKHRRIFDPLIASGSPSSREAARCLKADCIAGGAAFSFFVRQWCDRDLQVNWGEFRPAVLDLGARLRDHIKAEEVQIRLLLSHVREEASVEVRQ